MPRIHLFEGYGVELEYMIVDAESYNVRPIADQLIHAVSGEYTSDVEGPVISWSNELALHVIELKTSGPAASYRGLADDFHEEVCRINGLLKGMGARLLPGAMHPWMEPFTEMKLWPHEYSPVYEAYNRIFDCRGHGWANLQSTHLNLPFYDDEEFRRLHAAIRFLLPAIPALTAASPIYDGRKSGYMDSRLHVYRHNADRVPSIVGDVIPEAANSKKEYYERIFQPMWQDIAPLDRDTILQEEWLNSRGAIARFDRGSIEIRIIDVQECPAMDCALLWLISRVLQHLVTDEAAVVEGFPQLQLIALFDQAVKKGDTMIIQDPQWLDAMGHSGDPVSGLDFWRQVIDGYADDAAEAGHAEALSHWHKHGTLGRRLLADAGPTCREEQLRHCCRKMAACLEDNRYYSPDMTP